MKLYLNYKITLNIQQAVYFETHHVQLIVDMRMESYSTYFIAIKIVLKHLLHENLNFLNMGMYNIKIIFQFTITERTKLRLPIN